MIQFLPMHTQEKHKMLKSIKRFLQRFLQRVFKQPSAIDAYISSKHPKNAADVDHWVRVYYTQRGYYNR